VFRNPGFVERHPFLSALALILIALVGVIIRARTTDDDMDVAPIVPINPVMPVTSTDQWITPAAQEAQSDWPTSQTGEAAKKDESESAGYF
jgi:hypothetical protein